MPGGRITIKQAIIGELLELSRPSATLPCVTWNWQAGAAGFWRTR